MGPLPGETAAQRLQLALEMHDVGVALYRDRMRREHPIESEHEIDARVRRWLGSRPGDEVGDLPGPRSTRIL